MMICRRAGARSVRPGQFAVTLYVRVLKREKGRREGEEGEPWKLEGQVVEILSELSI
jgi:hypothetical protein